MINLIPFQIIDLEFVRNLFDFYQQCLTFAVQVQEKWIVGLARDKHLSYLV